MILKKLTNIGISLVLLLCSFLLYRYAIILPESILSGKNESIGPSTLPQFMAIVLAILSIALLITSMLKTTKTKDHAKVKTNWKLLFISLGLLIAYIFSIEKLGYITTTIIYSFVYMLILSSKKNIKTISTIGIISVLITIMLFILFEKVFLIFLPRGLMF